MVGGKLLQLVFFDLAHLKVEIDNFITNATKYIEDQQMPDGSWYVSQLHYYHFTGEISCYICSADPFKQGIISPGMAIGEYVSPMAHGLHLGA